MSNDKLNELVAEAEATCFDEWDRGYAAGLRAALAEIERHEAEKQAGPVAGDEFNSSQWWYAELDNVAKTDDQRRAMAVVRNLISQLEQARGAPPSESDKEDAEFGFAEAFRATWKQQIGGAMNTVGRDLALRIAVDAIRAARAKKEQP